MLVSVFYVVEYFFDTEFWLPKLCRRTSVYLWRVLSVTGHELQQILLYRNPPAQFQKPELNVKEIFNNVKNRNQHKGQSTTGLFPSGNT
jgi:hypothetical protein